MNEVVQMLVIKVSNSKIIMELQNNDNGDIIDQILYTIGEDSYKDDEKFLRNILFFERYFPYSITTIIKDKNTIELFIHLLRRVGSIPAVIILRNNSYYIKTNEIDNKGTVVLNNTVKRTDNLLLYFQELFDNYETENIIKCIKT